MKRRRSFTCLSSLKFCSQGTELNCSARPHCPPWVIGCGFPHPKKEENEERRRNSQTKGMENGSFRYTLILSHLFVFVSNNFLRRWFIPNMNLSSMISYSCVFSAFLATFSSWRNSVFVAAGTDAVLMSFRLLFVFPPLLWRIFRHLYRPLFLCARRVHFFAQVAYFPYTSAAISPAQAAYPAISTQLSWCFGFSFALPTFNRIIICATSTGVISQPMSR